MRRDAGISLHLVHFICVFLTVVLFTVCADFNVLFLRQFSSDFCNYRFILKRNVFATEVHCQISFFFKMYFFGTFSGKMKKKDKCIILMYCVYESINEHNADVTFFYMR